ncbi:S9 family peptidase [Kineosporia sp. A_224]|uniref:alpha/beta hydrolase family protein n=1 Tax=Kineosporia sp. A_224 TaxID=1962180 RepID=UPI00117BA3DE|nr:alpha/beta fold hydrolase [Kineosporia sp. A_224]
MTGTPQRPAALNLLLRGAVVGAGTVLAAGAAVSATAAYFARRVVSPDGERPDDVEILGVGAGTLTLRATAETTAPGRYGVWLDGGGGHARVGEVIDHDTAARTVTRRLVAVDSGRLREGAARWNQYYYAGTPGSALDLAYEDVEVSTALGAMPAWFVPPSASVPQRRTWVLLVHGRGATREECLRALPVLHRLGFPALVVSYRNDRDAAPSPGGRYHLGEAEWLDVESAVVHAFGAGAQDVVLAGWSMGGAIALQTMSRSWVADRIRAVVLDAPVVDWRDVLDHHAKVNRLPARIGRLSQAVLEHTHARRLAGVETPLSLDRLDWVTRAAELRVPVLLIHSDDDEFVPSGPSRRLALARPDVVTFVPVSGARHTKEWNVDPDGWDTAVARFLLSL